MPFSQLALHRFFRATWISQHPELILMSLRRSHSSHYLSNRVGNHHLMTKFLLMNSNQRLTLFSSWQSLMDKMLVVQSKSVIQIMLIKTPLCHNYMATIFLDFKKFGKYGIQKMSCISPEDSNFNAHCTK